MSEESAVKEQSGVDVINDMDLDPVTSAPESEQSLEGAVAEAVEAGASKQEIKKLIKEFELKVNGKSKKVKIDLNDERDLVRRLQLAEAGQSAMQEKAELEKMITNELLAGKKDPAKFLKENLGIDPDEWAEMRLQQKIEEMQKSPEVLAQERLQRELEDARAKLKQIEEEKLTERQIRLQEKAATELEKEIMDALASDKELPKSKKSVKRIAEAMLWALDQKDEDGNMLYPDVRVQDVLPSVKAEIRAEINELLALMPDEYLDSYIGKNTIERQRKQRLAAAKKAQSVPNNVDRAPAVVKQETKEKKAENARDFFRNLGRS